MRMRKNLEPQVAYFTFQYQSNTRNDVPLLYLGTYVSQSFQ